MRSSKSLITLIFGLLSMTSAHAQDRGGNGSGGGRGVVCRAPNGKIKSIELLDYLEARKTTSLLVDLGPGATYMEKIVYVASRIQKTDPVLANRILYGAQQFEKDAAFVAQSALVEISDVTNSLKPLAGCKEEQMAVNKINPLPFEKKFLVDQELWRNANATTKAGLVLHEILYLSARTMGDKTSDHSRYFNAFISSSNFSQLTTTAYIDLIKSLNWKFCYNGLYPWDGCRENLVSTANDASTFFSVKIDGVAYMIDGTLEFITNSASIKSGRLMAAAKLPTSIGPVDFNYSDSISFNENKTVEEARLADDLSLTIVGQTVKIPGKSYIKFSTAPEKMVIHLSNKVSLTAEQSASGLPMELSNTLYICSGKLYGSSIGSDDAPRPCPTTTSAGAK